MYFNYFTKKPFQGKNIEILENTNLTGGFLTFLQARKLGGAIPKGTKSVAKLIMPMLELKANTKGQLEEKMSGRKYSVFHISQVEFKEGEKENEEVTKLKV